MKIELTVRELRTCLFVYLVVSICRVNGWLTQRMTSFPLLRILNIMRN